MNDSTNLAIAAASGPLVSMVIPCYNHASYVQECIASVIAQDYKNIELIIIDDGSKDDSVLRIQEMVPACIDRFLRFEFRARENIGLSATLNEALEWAKGEYFAALASDDVVLPSKTSRLVECLRGKSGVAGAFGGMDLINELSEVIGTFNSNDMTCDFDSIITHQVIVNAPCQLLDLKAIRSVGGYATWVYNEDRYLWLRLTNAGYTLKIIKDKLVQYRQHESNMSKNIEKMHDSRILIMQDYRDKPLYGYAVAQIEAAAALEYSGSDRKKSITFLIKAIQCNAKIIFTFNFLYALLKNISPSFVINFLKRIYLWIKR